MLGVFEHDNVATVEIRSFHSDYAVTYLQGVLHGLRRNDKHLTDEGTQHSGDDESTDDNQSNFDGPRPEALPSLSLIHI